jgi:hypothetical protein
MTWSFLYFHIYESPSVTESTGVRWGNVPQTKAPIDAGFSRLRVGYLLIILVD